MRVGSTVRAVWVVVVLAAALELAALPGSVRAASLVVSPARIEAEVEPAGSTRWLHLYNRGEEPVAVRLYTGLGTQHSDGSPVYFDHPEAAAESGRLVRLERERLTLLPGEARQVEVRFSAVPGLVAAYPVIFIEFVEDETAQDPQAAPALRSNARLAIPVLLTYAGTEGLRRPEIAIEAVEGRVVPGSKHVEVDVNIRNFGNVHDWVRGRVALVGQDGEVRAEALLPEIRVLPGAARVVTARLEAPLTAMSGDSGAPAVQGALGVAASSTGRPATAAAAKTLGRAEAASASLSVQATSAAQGAETVLAGDGFVIMAVIYGEGWQSAPFLATYPQPAEVARAASPDGQGEPSR